MKFVSVAGGGAPGIYFLGVWMGVFGCAHFGGGA